MLAAAEDAVARSYSFPAHPESFDADVLPHITRLVISTGGHPRPATIRAVFAVLVRSDDKNDSPSDLFVYSLMQVPRATFVRWKATVDTLRADGGYGASAALLALATEPPPPSAPPSPPQSSDGCDDSCISLGEILNLDADALVDEPVPLHSAISNEAGCHEASLPLSVRSETSELEREGLILRGI